MIPESRSGGNLTFRHQPLKNFQSAKPLVSGPIFLELGLWTLNFKTSLSVHLRLCG
jgi:hypothetical protein